jgi:hypothetical protein
MYVPSTIKDNLYWLKLLSNPKVKTSVKKIIINDCPPQLLNVLIDIAFNILTNRVKTTTAEKTKLRKLKVKKVCNNLNDPKKSLKKKRAELCACPETLQALINPILAHYENCCHGAKSVLAADAN